MLDLLMKNWKLKSLMFFASFFHVIYKISNFNLWTAKHLAQASCTELTLYENVSIWVEDMVHFDIY